MSIVQGSKALVIGRYALGLLTVGVLWPKTVIRKQLETMVVKCADLLPAENSKRIGLLEKNTVYCLAEAHKDTGMNINSILRGLQKPGKLEKLHELHSDIFTDVDSGDSLKVTPGGEIVEWVTNES